MKATQIKASRGGSFSLAGYRISRVGLSENYSEQNELSQAYHMQLEMSEQSSKVECTHPS